MEEWEIINSELSFSEIEFRKSCADNSNNSAPEQTFFLTNEKRDAWSRMARELLMKLQLSNRDDRSLVDGLSVITMFAIGWMK